MCEDTEDSDKQSHKYMFRIMKLALHHISIISEVFFVIINRF